VDFATFVLEAGDAAQNFESEHFRIYRIYQMIFTITSPLLARALPEIRLRPYMVATGECGLHRTADDSIEAIARHVRFIHEGELRSARRSSTARYEIGFVPFTLDRPNLWPVLASVTHRAEMGPAPPLVSIYLGNGSDNGLISGVCTMDGVVLPVEEIHVVGAGMRRLAAVDFARPNPTVESGDEQRWNRLMGALDGPSVWQRLASLRCCIVGVGRSGSLVAATLARIGVRHLTLIDPDRLEPHNLDAMDAVTEGDIGRFKVEAVAAALLEQDGLQIATLAESVHTSGARAAMRQADVLICCADDDAARMIVACHAVWYARLLIDIGTGIFSDHQENSGGRRMGADIRMLIPGEACLLCVGGLANVGPALERWQRGEPRVVWHAERQGSRRTLNQIAVHEGLLLLEELVSERITGSVWLRREWDPHGQARPQTLPIVTRPACQLCAQFGLGDLAISQPLNILADEVARE
jgi:hypothetical protein